MKITRKTNILIQTERRFVAGQSRFDEQFWCEPCGEPMITAQTAAVLYRLSTRDVYRLIETGELHFIETDSKIVFVCPKNISYLTGSGNISEAAASANLKD